MFILQTRSVPAVSFNLKMFKKLLFAANWQTSVRKGIFSSFWATNYVWNVSVANTFDVKCGSQLENWGKGAKGLLGEIDKFLLTNWNFSPCVECRIRRCRSITLKLALLIYSFHINNPSLFFKKLLVTLSSLPLPRWV